MAREPIHDWAGTPIQTNRRLVKVVALSSCGSPLDRLLRQPRRPSPPVMGSVCVVAVSPKGGSGTKSVVSWNRKRPRPHPGSRQRSKAHAPESRAAPRPFPAQAVSDDDNDGYDTKAPTPKSKYHGVHWNRRKRKWRVRIKVRLPIHAMIHADDAMRARGLRRASRPCLGVYGLRLGLGSRV